MWAGLLELFSTIFGEEGALSSFLGKAGMQLEGEGILKDPTLKETATKEAPKGAKTAKQWKDRMKEWLPRNPLPPNSPLRGAPLGQSGSSEPPMPGNPGGPPTFTSGSKSPVSGIPIPLPVQIVGPLPLPVEGKITGTEHKPNTSDEKPKEEPKEKPKGRLTGLASFIGKIGEISKQANYILILAGAGYYLLKKVVGTLAEFAFTVSEANRDLAVWNGQIASSFLNLDLTRQELDIQQAESTSGSTTVLNQSLEELLMSVQPLVTTASSLVNLVAIGAAKVTTIAAEIVKGNSYIKRLMEFVGAVEKKINKGPAIRPDTLGRDALEALVKMRAPGDPGTRLDLRGADPRAALPPIPKGK